jgi:myosin heavy subunit
MSDKAGVEDMIVLGNLTEETLLNNLKIRYKGDFIYVRDITGHRNLQF